MRKIENNFQDTRLKASVKEQKKGQGQFIPLESIDDEW